MHKAILYTNGLMLALVIVSGAILSSSIANAESITANASVTVSSACTFTSTVDSAHSAVIPAGTYKDNIGTTTLKAICNDSEGFSIYAVGFSNEQLGNNKLIATVAGSLSPTNDINTGTNTSGDPSSWAMKLSTVSGGTTPTILNNYDSYHSVPTTNTKVVTYASTTDATLGASITTTYAANISGTQPAGTYVGKVKYTFLHPATAVPNEPKDCPARSVCYWPNGNGLVTDTMGDQGGSLNNNQSVNLWASNFQRKGYGFAGWSTTYDYSDPTGFYGPNETITTPSDMTEKGLSLYAIWIESDGSLQNWSACPALNIGDVTALTDTRNNETYAVAKLADGNCWMIENLRLDNDATGNSDGSLAQGYASGFIGLADPEIDDFSASTTANSLYSTTNITGANQSNRFPRFNNQNTDSPAASMTTWGNTSNTYSVGNYYTWSAAVADKGDYTTDNQTIANTSICPSGWELPSGGSSTNASDSDFWKLGLGIMGFAPSNNTNYQSSELNANGKTANAAYRSYPNNFIYSGIYNTSAPVNRGSTGVYWSSTVYNFGSSYRLQLNGSIVYPGTYSNAKTSGQSIRCLKI